MVRVRKVNVEDTSQVEKTTSKCKILKFFYQSIENYYSKFIKF